MLTQYMLLSTVTVFSFYLLYILINNDTYKYLSCKNDKILIDTYKYLYIDKINSAFVVLNCAHNG